MNYEPKKLNFDKDILDKNNIKLLGCGRKHYVIVTNDNNMLIWGNVIKDESNKQSEGYSLYNGDSLFENGAIE